MSAWTSDLSISNANFIVALEIVIWVGGIGFDVVVGAIDFEEFRNYGGILVVFL